MGDPPHPALEWRVALRDASIDSTAKLVGLVLSTYMNGAGFAAVSRSTLAGACGLADVSTVLRAVHRLEASGLLGVDRIAGGRYGCNRYQARSNSGWPATDERSNSGAPATDGESNGGWNRDLTVAGEPPEVEDQKTYAGARAREERGEGYGDPSAAQLARDAAAAARAKILGGEP